jgi:uncharacterized protein YpmS
MRFLKRLFRILVAVLILGAIGLGVLYHMSKRLPGGYTPRLLSQTQRDEAEKRVLLQKLPQLTNLASQLHAQGSSTARAQSRGDAPPAAATEKLDPVTVSFTQDEINASLWKGIEQYKSNYERYVVDPYVVLEDNAIVLMGTVPEFDRVASAYFEPRLDDQGMLRCDLTSLKVGALPLPEGLFAKHRAKVENALRARLPEWQRKATIEPSGLTNADARAAALGKIVLQILNRQPSPAVLFIPKDYDKPTKGSVPVRLTKVAVQKEALTITVEPMTLDQRTALLEKIREPQEPARS